MWNIWIEQSASFFALDSVASRLRRGGGKVNRPRVDTIFSRVRRDTRGHVSYLSRVNEDIS